MSLEDHVAVERLPFPTRSRDFDFVDEYLGMESSREFRVPVRARWKPQKEPFLTLVATPVERRRVLHFTAG